MADRPIAIDKEIEVTPEMVEAGVKALYESGIVDNWSKGASDRLVVESVIKSALQYLN